MTHCELVISFGSKKAGGVLGIRMLSSYGAADNLWGTEEPKKPTGTFFSAPFRGLTCVLEIVTALGLNDKSLLTIEELLATVLSKADSGLCFVNVRLIPPTTFSKLNFWSPYWLVSTEVSHDRDLVNFFFVAYVKVISSEKLLDFLLSNFLFVYSRLPSSHLGDPTLKRASSCSTIGSKTIGTRLQLITTRWRGSLDTLGLLYLLILG